MLGIAERRTVSQGIIPRPHSVRGTLRPQLFLAYTLILLASACDGEGVDSPEPDDARVEVLELDGVPGVSGWLSND